VQIAAVRLAGASARAGEDDANPEATQGALAAFASGVRSHAHRFVHDGGNLDGARANPIDVRPA